MSKTSLQEILSAHNARFSCPPIGNFLYDAWPDFAKSLRRIARAFYSDDTYIPSSLGTDHGIDSLSTVGAISSFHEFWQTLPECFSQHFTFSENELDALFCSLADPPRFGTAPGRYPEQISDIKSFLSQNGILNPTILDVGCGTGLGTLELAAACNAGYTLGITPEPLEIKMAQNRYLPHDPIRTSRYNDYRDIKADFQLGGINDFGTDRTFHIITCNGLIGGPIIHSQSEMQNFLFNCARHLEPGGRVFCANNFHDGHRPNVEKLLSMTSASITNWHNINFAF